MGERNRRGIVIAVFLSLGVAAMACSSDDAMEREDAGSFEADAGEVDAPYEPGAFVEVMPTDPDDIASCDDAPLDAQAGYDFCPGASCGECDDEGGPLEVIARASDLEEGARFVTMRDELVLAEAANGRPILYRFDYRQEAPEVRLVPIPFQNPLTHSSRIPAIAGFVGNGSAVVCTNDECWMHLILNEGSGVAKPLAIPVPVDEKGIEGAFLTYGEEASMCIYGDGVHCIRSGAFETIVTGEGGRLLAVDERGEWLVGENGRVVRLQGYEASEPYHGTSARLHTVASSFDGKSAWAAGEGGVFLALGEAGPRICKAPSFDIVAATSSKGGSLAWVEKSGTSLAAPASDRKRWCSVTAPISNVLAADIMDCDPVKKRRLLSATEIRGEVEGMYACAPPPPPPEDIRKPPFPPPSPTGWAAPPIFPADR